MAESPGNTDPAREGVTKQDRRYRSHVKRHRKADFQIEFRWKEQVI